MQDGAGVTSDKTVGKAHRHKISLPPTTSKIKPWAAAGKAAMQHVLGEDELGLLATAMYVPARPDVEDLHQLLV